MEMKEDIAPGRRAALKVFRLNDNDWWVAESLEEAKADYLKVTGLTEDEAFDGEAELSDADLDRLHIFDEDFRRTRSFRERLEQIAADPLESVPGIFASTEI